MVKKRTRILRLSDGRIVEYAEYGDPRGKPVFFFHGCFGSCHQGSLADVHAKKEGLRIISPNRPGVGRSDIADFHSMTDYADDIRQVADILGCETFAIMGASAGGCFALACQYVMPERVRLVGAAGCIGPLNVLNNLRQISWFRRWFLTACHDYPLLARRLFQIMFSLCRKYPERMFRLLTNTSTAIDSQLFKEDGVEEILRLDYESVFRQESGIDALLLEIRMYFHWGFELQNFPRYKRVFFWHGESDGIIPWPIIRRAARFIHGAETMVYPGGHLTFVMHEMGAMLTKVRKEWNYDTWIVREERGAQKAHESGGFLYPPLLRHS